MTMLAEYDNGGRTSTTIVVPRIVGLDLSLTSTGIAVIEGGIVTTHRVRSTGRKGASTEQTARRIHSLTMEIANHTGRSSDPALVVIEAPSFGSVHGAQHERGGLWWAVAMVCVAQAWPIATVSPQGRARYATGRGNAGKDEVLAAAIKRWPDVDISGNDVADAVIIASMGARHLGCAIDAMPANHLTAMAGANWPTGAR